MAPRPCRKAAAISRRRSSCGGCWGFIVIGASALKNTAPNKNRERIHYSWTVSHQGPVMNNRPGIRSCRAQLHKQPQEQGWLCAGGDISPPKRFFTYEQENGPIKRFTEAAILVGNAIVAPCATRLLMSELEHNRQELLRKTASRSIFTHDQRMDFQSRDFDINCFSVAPQRQLTAAGFQADKLG